MTKIRVLQKSITRRRLIEAALELSAAKGFSAISIREVTHAAAITPAAFYRHFRDLEDLGLALLDEVGVSLRQLLRNARREFSSERGFTERSIQVFMDYVGENPNHFRLLQGERQGSSAAFRAALRAELDRFVVELTEDLERISREKNQQLRRASYAAEAIVAVVFTVGAEFLDLPKHRRDGLATRIVAEVKMIMLGSLRRKPR